MRARDADGIFINVLEQSNNAYGLALVPNTELCNIPLKMSKQLKNPAIPVADAARLSGLSVDMITYLGRVDILKATHGGGRGSRRLFTFGDVLFLKTIADLLARGIEVARLKSGLRKARAEVQGWIDIRTAPRYFLVTDGTELFVRRRGELESKTMNGQLAFAFVVDLAASHRTISSAWPDEVTKVPSAGMRRQK